MTIKNLIGNLRERLFTRWVACRPISDKGSVQYGIYFSYPIYIFIVFVGVSLQNPYILLLAALVAFLGVKLPMHPFDYVYNYVAKLMGTSSIPGRGSELQVNSIVSLLFNLIVVVLLALSILINYGILSTIYVLSSVFFIGIFLLKD